MPNAMAVCPNVDMGVMPGTKLKDSGEQPMIAMLRALKALHNGFCGMRTDISAD